MSNKMRDLSQKLRSGILLAQRTVEGRDFSLMLFNGGGVKTPVCNSCTCVLQYFQVHLGRMPYTVEFVFEKKGNNTVYRFFFVFDLKSVRLFKHFFSLCVFLYYINANKFCIPVILGCDIYLYL